jgi:CBS domain-containing protein
MNIARVLSTKGKGVYTARPDQSIREAIEILTRHNIGALVVTDQANKPVGIISERDIVRHLLKHEDLFAQPVSFIMTTHLITGMPQDDLKAVANTMTDKRIRHLPVVEHDQLVGIVSIGDVVKVQRDQYQGEVDTLQTQILGNST